MSKQKFSSKIEKNIEENNSTESGCCESTLTSDKTLKQLKRIRGQMDGIIKMYEDGRGCIEIVHQILAARNSLGKVSRNLLSDEASRCSKERRIEDLDNVIKEFLKY